VDFFGSAISPYAGIACIVSFLMPGHRSVFPTPVLSFQKSTSVHVAIGTELEQIRTSPQLRDKSLTGLLLRILEKIKDGIRKRPHSGEPDP
jgi:hypothetical protein